MVFIVAASSVHHDVDALSLEQESNYKDKVNAIPGLSTNLYAKNPKKIVGNLLSKDLKDKTKNIVWHDVLNNSICRQKSENSGHLSVTDLMNVLKIFQDKLSALVYCQRDRTPDIIASIQELGKSNSI